MSDTSKLPSLKLVIRKDKGSKENAWAVVNKISSGDEAVSTTNTTIPKRPKIVFKPSNIDALPQTVDEESTSRPRKRKRSVVVSEELTGDTLSTTVDGRQTKRQKVEGSLPTTPPPVDTSTTLRTYMPLRKALSSLLSQLIRADQYGFFYAPVSEKDVPDYYTIIKNPMCFTKMREKLNQQQYRSLAAFTADFNLICSNAKTYNAPTTIYYQEAERLSELGQKLIESYKEKLSPSNIDSTDAASSVAEAEAGSSAVSVRRSAAKVRRRDKAPAAGGTAAASDQPTAATPPSSKPSTPVAAAVEPPTTPPGTKRSRAKHLANGAGTPPPPSAPAAVPAATATLATGPGRPTPAPAAARPQPPPPAVAMTNAWSARTPGAAAAHQWLTPAATVLTPSTPAASTVSTAPTTTTTSSTSTTTTSSSTAPTTPTGTPAAPLPQGTPSSGPLRPTAPAYVRTAGPGGSTVVASRAGSGGLVGAGTAPAKSGGFAGTGIPEKDEKGYSSSLEAFVQNVGEAALRNVRLFLESLKKPSPPVSNGAVSASLAPLPSTPTSSAPPSSSSVALAASLGLPIGSTLLRELAGVSEARLSPEELQALRSLPSLGLGVEQELVAKLNRMAQSAASNAASSASSSSSSSTMAPQTQKIQELLDRNCELLYTLQLHQSQRASSTPSEWERTLATQLSTNLSSLSASLPPGSLTSSSTFSTKSAFSAPTPSRSTVTS